jgi:hypothetical protein
VIAKASLFAERKRRNVLRAAELLQAIWTPLH